MIGKISFYYTFSILNIKKNDLLPKFKHLNYELRRTFMSSYKD